MKKFPSILRLFMDASAQDSPTHSPSDGFSSLSELPANAGGDQRVDILRHADATIFSFARKEWFAGCPDETCVRWLYCRLLDNTCRRFGISPDLSDTVIVEALRNSGEAFAPAHSILGYQDPFASGTHPAYSLLPPEHPEMDPEKLSAFMSTRAKNISLFFGFDSFFELRGQILSYDSLCESYGDDASFGDGDPRSYREHRADMDPRLFADTERAMAFATRLASCIAVAAYLRRFAARADSLLDASRTHRPDQSTDE